MQVKISDYELGWLVGILEGEGYFAYVNRGHRVNLQMTDEDAVNSAAIIINKIIGKEVKITHRMPRNSKHQESYQIVVGGESARILMKTIVPFMHGRRRSRIWQSLNNYTAPKQKTLKELGIDISDLIRRKEETL